MTVVNSLAQQLNAASNSVDNLGKRTRVMSRKLKDVEALPDQQPLKSFWVFQGKMLLIGVLMMLAKRGVFDS